jgi:phosphatidylethanolamine-binding protein (PEBP) family uncharacterized protein
VAQRTAADRFLGDLARTASAGIVLALAVAVFLLSGCGGGSSDPQSSSSSKVETAPGSADPSGQKSLAGGKPQAKEGATHKSSSGQTGAQTHGSVGQGHQEHGPHIAQPKGAPEHGPTPEQIASATVADVTLRSPAIVGSEGTLGRLSSAYTCDGQGKWPALHWSGVPSGTAELVLFAMNLQPVEGRIFFDWAVAGLDPSSESIEAGKLPSGAVVGTNGFGKRGYEICPGGAGETYMFALYALPNRLSPTKGFDPLALREQVLDASGNVGFLPTVYERG